MLNLKLFNVAPKIPEDIRFLEELSYNMWWCWHYDAIDLFRRINAALWRKMDGNTRQFLSEISQDYLEELANDNGFLRHLKRVQATYMRHMGKKVDDSEKRIAYFSLEYGIHESVRLFSGGLGVLAGDHLKAASDQQIPIVAVGLLYRQGYFRQFLDRSGWQMERYPENEIHNMPIKRALDREGNEVTIKMKLLDRDLLISVWQLDVGTVPLILLDTEIPENPPEFREITWRLYGGDKRMRLHQELLLGIGGYLALLAIGYDPAVCHMNEGHAAFLSLARIAHLVKSKGLDINTAIEVVWRSNVFTTHTPVPAGNEVFDIELVKPYLEALKGNIPIDVDRIINWGLPVDGTHPKEISMTILGLRMAGYSNGVSRLHGKVARNMWQTLWPGRPLDEIPITYITNGVHVASWISERKKLIYDHYLSPDWLDNPNNQRVQMLVDKIPDEELWLAHEMCRQSLIRHARRRIKWQMKTREMSPGKAFQIKNFLSHDVLTIGFARRFATYKRATLLLRDKARLKALLTNPERPVQIIFAGKAHPADESGKRLIQEIIEFARDPDVRSRIVFLEDYDIGLARYMVQGVDVWLNTPTRPQEASGTSGMKAAINGVLNCSIRDGWWDEGFSPNCGWAIDSEDSYEYTESRNELESQNLYNLLEEEIVPCFYDRSEGDLPQAWVRMMKGAIKMSIYHFSSRRMVNEYYERFYKPAMDTYDRLTANDAAEARDLVTQKDHLKQHQDTVKIDYPEVDHELNNMHVGDKFKVRTNVYLGEMKPEDIDVEVYYGPVDSQNNILESNTAVMNMVEDLGNGHCIYEYEVICECSGRFGLTARVTPAGEDWSKGIPGFIRWA